MTPSSIAADASSRANSASSSAHSRSSSVSGAAWLISAPQLDRPFSPLHRRTGGRRRRRSGSSASSARGRSSAAARRHAPLPMRCLRRRMSRPLVPGRRAPAHVSRSRHYRRSKEYGPVRQRPGCVAICCGIEKQRTGCDVRLQRREHVEACRVALAGGDESQRWRTGRPRAAGQSADCGEPVRPAAVLAG